jgi:hypothetical protein
MGPFGLGSWRASAWIGALVILVLGASDAAAQSGPKIEVSPFVATGTKSVVRNIPEATAPAGARQVRFHANFMFGLIADLSWHDTPLRLRGGVSRTFGGNLETLSQSDMASVASAATTTLWGDVVLTPYSGGFAPYAFVGVARQTTSYGDMDAAIAPYFDRTDHDSILRYGIGLEIDLVGNSVLWMEFAKHSGLQSLSNQAPPSALRGPRPGGAMGLRIPLF